MPWQVNTNEKIYPFRSSRLLPHRHVERFDNGSASDGPKSTIDLNEAEEFVRNAQKLALEKEDDWRQKEALHATGKDACHIPAKCAPATMPHMMEALQPIVAGYGFSGCSKGVISCLQAVEQLAKENAILFLELKLLRALICRNAPWCTADVIDKLKDDLKLLRLASSEEMRNMEADNSEKVEHEEVKMPAHDATDTVNRFDHGNTGGPSIIKEPENFSVWDESPAVITLRHRRTTYFRWTRSGKRAVGALTFRKPALYFPRLQERHSGMYACDLLNDYGQALTREARVAVYKPQSNTVKRIVCRRPLVCAQWGGPNAEMIWACNSKYIEFYSVSSWQCLGQYPSSHPGNRIRENPEERQLTHSIVGHNERGQKAMKSDRVMRPPKFSSQSFSGSISCACGTNAASAFGFPERIPGKLAVGFRNGEICVLSAALRENSYGMKHFVTQLLAQAKEAHKHEVKRLPAWEPTTLKLRHQFHLHTSDHLPYKDETGKVSLVKPDNTTTMPSGTAPSHSQFSSDSGKLYPTAPSSVVSAISWLPFHDGASQEYRYLASGGRDGFLKIWALCQNPLSTSPMSSASHASPSFMSSMGKPTSSYCQDESSSQRGNHLDDASEKHESGDLLLVYSARIANGPIISCTVTPLSFQDSDSDGAFCLLALTSESSKSQVAIDHPRAPVKGAISLVAVSLRTASLIQAQQVPKYEAPAAESQVVGSPIGNPDHAHISNNSRQHSQKQLNSAGTSFSHDEFLGGPTIGPQRTSSTLSRSDGNIAANDVRCTIIWTEPLAGSPTAVEIVHEQCTQYVMARESGTEKQVYQAEIQRQKPHNGQEIFTACHSEVDSTPALATWKSHGPQNSKLACSLLLAVGITRSLTSSEICMWRLTLTPRFALDCGAATIGSQIQNDRYFFKSGVDGTRAADGTSYVTTSAVPAMSRTENAGSFSKGTTGIIKTASNVKPEDILMDTFPWHISVKVASKLTPGHTGPITALAVGPRRCLSTKSLRASALDKIAKTQTSKDYPHNVTQYNTPDLDGSESSFTTFYGHPGVLLSGGIDGAIILWDLRWFKARHRIVIAHNAAVSSIQWQEWPLHPDGCDRQNSAFSEIGATSKSERRVVHPRHPSKNGQQGAAEASLKMEKDASPSSTINQGDAAFLSCSSDRSVCYWRIAGLSAFLSQPNTLEAWANQTLRDFLLAQVMHRRYVRRHLSRNATYLTTQCSKLLVEIRSSCQKIKATELACTQKLTKLGEERSMLQKLADNSLRLAETAAQKEAVDRAAADTRAFTEEQIDGGGRAEQNPPKKVHPEPSLGPSEVENESDYLANHLPAAVIMEMARGIISSLETVGSYQQRGRDLSRECTVLAREVLSKEIAVQNFTSQAAEQASEMNANATSARKHASIVRNSEVVEKIWQQCLEQESEAKELCLKALQLDKLLEDLHAKAGEIRHAHENDIQVNYPLP